jgi:hypothetical protein
VRVLAEKNANNIKKLEKCRYFAIFWCFLLANEKCVC